MKKKCNVVMLATTDKAKVGAIYISVNDAMYTHNEVSASNCNNSCGTRFKNQHLYITSDEEIKEGDWVVIDLGEETRITQVVSLRGKHIEFNVEITEGYAKLESLKKIIATTDKLATEPYQGHYNGIDCTNYLPQPSPQFIQKYIDEYNRGNKIEWVSVEYEPIGNWRHGEFVYTRDIPKVDKNNYITITKIKDSWNKEEVEKLCRSAYNAGISFGLDSHISIATWIEKNL